MAQRFGGHKAAGRFPPPVSGNGRRCSNPAQVPDFATVTGGPWRGTRQVKVVTQAGRVWRFLPSCQPLRRPIHPGPL